MGNGQNGQDGMTGAGQRKRALRSEAAGRVYGRHSGFRNLKVYQVADLLYDYTWFRRGARAASKIIGGGRGLGEPQGRAGVGGRARCQSWRHPRRPGALAAERLMDRQSRDFEAGGGFSERLYRARTEAREAGRDGQNGRNGQNGQNGG